MAKVEQSREELEQHLKDHVGFLQSSADAFDRGADGEAKRLAVSLRVLLHDTGNSHSLLGQLGRLAHGKFMSTALPHEEASIATHGGLVMMAGLGKETRYIAPLDDTVATRWIPFKDWWNETVFVDDKREKMSRRDLVLAVANQDGGAHVDAKLNETYGRLSRHNSMGWVHSDGKSETPIPKVERAAMRQVAHEVLATLDPTYRRKPDNSSAQMIFGGAMVVNGATPPPLPKVEKLSRNGPCPCGSGRRYKRCHGAGRP